MQERRINNDTRLIARYCEPFSGKQGHFCGYIEVPTDVVETAILHPHDDSRHAAEDISRKYPEFAGMFPGGITFTKQVIPAFEPPYWLVGFDTEYHRDEYTDFADVWVRLGQIYQAMPLEVIE